MFKISTSHPLPDNIKPNKRGQKHSERQETIAALEVRHSFFMPVSIESVSPLMWWAKAKFPNRAFVARSREENGELGVRIWRTR